MLGYSVAYFLGKEWRNTPLYAEKIIPLLDYLLSNNYEFNDKLSGAFYELTNKYQNTMELPVESLKELVYEHGYSYVADLVADDENMFKLLVYLLALIHNLKGTKRGIAFVMSLFSYGTGRKMITIKEWLQEIPETRVKADLQDWFRTSPATPDDIDTWVRIVRGSEYNNEIITTWIGEIPLEETITEQLEWYDDMPVSYQTLLEWLSKVQFEEDLRIEEWFEGEEIGEENTFSIPTFKADIQKLSSDFFIRLDNFVRNYVYPELETLRVNTCIETSMTIIPFSRMNWKLKGVGRITGYDGTEESDIMQYSTFNPQILAIDGVATWEISIPFDGKVVSEVYRVSDNSVVNCSKEYDYDNKKLYVYFHTTSPYVYAEEYCITMIS